MKTISLALFLVLTAFFVYEAEADINRPGDWSSSTGTTSQEGKATDVNDQGNKITLKCEGSVGCCWEIHDDGGVTVYTNLASAPPAPAGAAPPTPIGGAPTDLINNNQTGP